jgi:hypothetical protein
MAAAEVHDVPGVYPFNGAFTNITRIPGPASEDRNVEQTEIQYRKAYRAPEVDGDTIRQDFVQCLNDCGINVATMDYLAASPHVVVDGKTHVEFTFAMRRML